MSSLSEVSKAWVERIIDGKFPLRQWLGGSGHSAVFLTERGAPASQKAAIKLISVDALPARTEDAQLSHWAKAAKLSHPHLMQVFECGRCQIDDVPFLYVVQEYAEENLAQIIPERALGAEEVAQMLPPVAQALAFLHQSGWVHSRIQPSNVMAVQDQLKITADSLCKMGEPGARRGSAYDAPEVATVLTPAADVWSLGVLLVAVLSQHEPAVNHRNDGQVGVPNAIPHPFNEIAHQCLRADPRRRITIHQILGKLKSEAAVSEAASPNSPAPPAPVSVAPAVAVKAAAREPRSISAALPPASERPKRGAIFPIALVILIVVVLLGYVMFRHSQQGSTTTSSPQFQPASTSGTNLQSPPAQPPSASNPTAIRGRVAHQVIPEISAGAQKSIHGRLKINIQVSVDAAGNVSQAKIIQHAPSQYFAREALAATRRWKFDPPQVNGHSSPSEWLLHFQFSRSGTQVSSTQTKP